MSTILHKNFAQLHRTSFTLYFDQNRANAEHGGARVSVFSQAFYRTRDMQHRTTLIRLSSDFRSRKETRTLGLDQLATTKHHFIQKLLATSSHIFHALFRSKQGKCRTSGARDLPDRLQRRRREGRWADHSCCRFPSGVRTSPFLGWPFLGLQLPL